jgi:hypothetical protein
MDADIESMSVNAGLKQLTVALKAVTLLKYSA